MKLPNKCKSDIQDISMGCVYAGPPLDSDDIKNPPKRHESSATNPTYPDNMLEPWDIPTRCVYAGPPVVDPHEETSKNKIKRFFSSLFRRKKS